MRSISVVSVSQCAMKKIYKRSRIFVFLIPVVAFVIWYRVKYSTSQAHGLSHLKSKQLSYILFYTSFFGLKDWGFGEGQGPFAQCLVQDCYITSDCAYLNEVSLFNGLMFNSLTFHFRRTVLVAKAEHAKV